MHALIFDLDGTLVDSVYAHVLAWQGALDEAGLVVDGYRLHRHVGSSGNLIVRFAQRKPVASCPWNKGRPFTGDTNSFFVKDYPARGRCRAPSKCSALCAPREFRTPSPQRVTGRSSTLPWKPSGRAGDGGCGRKRRAARQARAGPLPGGQKQLGVAAAECIVVGDAVWDHVAARRAGMMSVGVLTGGYGEEELYHAGAFRVYRIIADLLQNLDELGILL